MQQYPSNPILAKAFQERQYIAACADDHWMTRIFKATTSDLQFAVDGSEKNTVGRRIRSENAGDVGEQVEGRRPGAREGLERGRTRREGLACLRREEGGAQEREVCVWGGGGWRGGGADRRGVPGSRLVLGRRRVPTGAGSRAAA